MLLLHCKQLPRRRVQMSLLCGVDAIAPLARQLVDLRPTGEAAAGQEVILDMIELPLDMRRSIGITQFMRRELEAVSICKSRHLRHRHHRATGSAQDYNVRVVDLHAPG